MKRLRIGSYILTCLIALGAASGCKVTHSQTDKPGSSTETTQPPQEQSEPVKWTFEQVKTGKNQYDLKLTATIGKGWHLYSQFLPDAEIRPVPTSIVFKDTTAFIKEGKATEGGRVEHVYDANFAMNLTYYSEIATFTQKVTLTKPVNEIKGYVEFMVCDNEKCLPPTQRDFSFTVNYEK